MPLKGKSSPFQFYGSKLRKINRKVSDLFLLFLVQKYKQNYQRHRKSHFEELSNHFW